MSVIPVVASAADLDAAIKFANRNRSARWYVARRAEALGAPGMVPDSWGLARPGLVAAFSGEWSDSARAKAASKGVAMSDGSYPIKDKADLKRAILAFGRAKKGDKEAVRKHIIERARTLGARNLLPESWHGAMTASLQQVLGKGSLEVSEALLDDAIERGLVTQVGTRNDGAILYDLDPEGAEDLTALAAAFYTADDLGNPDDEETEPAPDDEEAEAQEPTHAGLAVQAADTGRVLMLQRALDPDDPAAGKWEFPGGGIDDEDDSPFDGACREFCEETGLGVPDGDHSGQWTSPNGVYQGHLLIVPVEADAFNEINPDVEAAHNVDNPDDPHRENPEVTAWMHPDELQGNPAVRSEVLESTPWDLFDNQASDGVDSDSEQEPDPGDPNEEQEPPEVNEKYKPLVAAANGCHSLNLPYPEDLQGVAYVLLRDLEGDYNTPLFASGFSDWEEHPDAVAPARAYQYEAIVACAEEAGMTAGAVLRLKAAQKRLGWATAEQLSEVIAGDLLENHPTPTLEAIRDFLKPHAPLLASAIDEFLAPITAAWNPNLHPRGRGGEFIEVGDIVNVFDGLNFDTPSFQGKVTGNHAGSDGKVMIAVTDVNNVVHAVDPSHIDVAPDHKASLDGPNAPAAPQTREEKQAARQAKNEADFPVGTKVNQTVYGINDKQESVDGTVSGHKGGSVYVDTPSHGTLASEPGKLTKIEDSAAPADGPLQNPDGSLARIPNVGESPDNSGMNEEQKQALRDRVSKSNLYQRMQTDPGEQAWRNSRDKRLQELSTKSPEEIQKAVKDYDTLTASYAKVYGENAPITVRSHIEAQMAREMLNGGAPPPKAPSDGPAPSAPGAPGKTFADLLKGDTFEQDGHTYQVLHHGSPTATGNVVKFHATDESGTVRTFQEPHGTKVSGFGADFAKAKSDHLAAPSSGSGTDPKQALRDKISSPGVGLSKMSDAELNNRLARVGNSYNPSSQSPTMKAQKEHMDAMKAEIERRKTASVKAAEKAGQTNAGGDHAELAKQLKGKPYGTSGYEFSGGVSPVPKTKSYDNEAGDKMDVGLVRRNAKGDIVGRQSARMTADRMKKHLDGGNPPKA